jgi:hypothetical protein
MQRELARKLLRSIIPPEAWDEEQLQGLFADLEAMADYKYNRYEMYQPGRLFLENLYLWLSSLDPGERKAALEFVRDKLIFVSRDEFQQLAQILYFDGIHQRQLDVTARRAGVPRHRVRKLAASEEFKRLQRASLFVGMSDGARIDYFRRQNLDINNEQVLPTYQPSPEKVKDLVAELEKSQGKGARFSCLFLLDDFCGSGKTLLREVVREQVAEPLDGLSVPKSLGAHLKYDEEKRVLELAYSEAAIGTEAQLRHLSTHKEYGRALDALMARAKARHTELKGSLVRLFKDSDLGKALAPDARVFLCPLLITEYALVRLRELAKRLAPPMATLEVLYGAVVPNGVRIAPGAGPISDICERHYTDDLADQHTGSVKFGYDQCGLPLVLHHNTPNNSIFILWARRWNHPLFIRYERHGREVG